MKKKTGFTLAEVLITLAIIGIIAALVIPAVMTNFQFRMVGVRLSKFMSTVENSTRAFVVSDEALPNYIQNDDDTNGVLARYISQTFSMTNVGQMLTPPAGSATMTAANITTLAGGALDQTEGMAGGFLIALNAGPTPREIDPATGELSVEPNEAILKDGTRAHFWLLDPQGQGGAAPAENVMWHGHTAPPTAVIGNPVIGIVFDPVANIIPRNARRTFGFIITSQGFVVPAGVDDCLHEIIDARWETRQDTFTNGACANGQIQNN